MTLGITRQRLTTAWSHTLSAEDNQVERSHPERLALAVERGGEGGRP